MKTPIWKYAVRLIALPFVAGICVIRYTCHLIHYCIHFMRYGGEMVILDASIKTFLVEQAEAKKQLVSFCLLVSSVFNFMEVVCIYVSGTRVRILAIMLKDIWEKQGLFPVNISGLDLMRGSKATMILFGIM